MNGAYEKYVRFSCEEAARLAALVDSGHPEIILREVRAVWVEAESPSRCPDAWNRIWRAVARLSTPPMSWRERLDLRFLPARLTVYRGCLPGGERGWSWTLDRSIAEDFAHRHYLPGETLEPVLCCTEIDKTDVIALFRLGAEREIILDPDDLDWDGVEMERLGGQGATG